MPSSVALKSPQNLKKAKAGLIPLADPPDDEPAEVKLQSWFKVTFLHTAPAPTLTWSDLSFDS